MSSQIVPRKHVAARRILRFIRVWTISFAAAGGILLLIPVGFATYLGVRAWRDHCPEQPFPTADQAASLARNKFEYIAWTVDVPPDQFVLKKAKTEWLFPVRRWVLVYQLESDVERPRHIRVVVDRCGQASDNASDPYEEWHPRKDESGEVWGGERSDGRNAVPQTP